MNKGRIVKIVSDDYTIATAKERIVCKAKGIFRLQKITPMVGDLVEFSDEKVINKIYPRKNQLQRPFVSNVDQVVIVMSTNHPKLSTYLLDKLIVIIEYNRIIPVICFTKIDLLTNKTLFSNIKSYYKKIGYQVFTNENNDILKIFTNKITVFAGQTGAGKSSLLNQLDKRLQIKTDEISKALGRGKHTTRHVELYDLGGGFVADTPGFSALDLQAISKESIRDSFVEFKELRQHCQYRNCFHIHEEDCQVKKEVAVGTILKSRYQNYLKFCEEVLK